MKPRISYDEGKNLILQQTRGIGFEDVIKAIEQKHILADLKHHDQNKYPNQRILVISIKNYAYAVPYVIDAKKQAIFLKTIYPSRALTKKYLRSNV